MGNLNNAQYREKYPTETQGVSDYDLASALYQQQGGGVPFDQFAKDFLVPAEAAAPIPDRTPVRQPYVPGQGLIGTVKDRIVGTVQIGASALMSSTAGFLGRGNDAIHAISDAQTAVFGPHPNDAPDDTLSKATKFLLDNAKELETLSKEHGSGYVDKLIGNAVGGAPMGFAEFRLNVPWAMLTGASEAHKAGNSEIWGAMTHGAKQYMLQRIFGSINGMNAGKFLKGNLSGLAFAIDTLIQGGSLEDASQAYGTGILYQFMPGGTGAKKDAAKGKAGRALGSDPLVFDTKPGAEAGITNQNIPMTEVPPVSGDSFLKGREPGVTDQNIPLTEVPTAGAEAKTAAEAATAIKANGVEMTPEAPPPTVAEKAVLAAGGRVLYHGTGADFTEFDPAKASPSNLFGPNLIFMTENPERAGSYAIQGEQPNIRPVTVDMKNPIDMDKPADPNLVNLYVHEKAVSELDTWNRHMGTEEGKMGQTDAEIVKAKEATIRADLESNGDISNMKIVRLINDHLGGSLPDRLQALGYDGITHMGGMIRGEVVPGDIPHRVFASWNASQIKSVFDSAAAEKATGKPAAPEAPADAPPLPGPRLSEAEITENKQLQSDAASLRSRVFREEGDKVGKGSGLVNLGRLGRTPNDVKRVIDEVAKQREADTAVAAGKTDVSADGKPVRTLKDVEAAKKDLAKSLGMEDRQDFVSQLKKDTGAMEERLLLGRQILADQGVLVDKLIKDSATGSKLSMVRFFQELHLFNDILPDILGSQAHIARTVTAGRIAVTGKLHEPGAITTEKSPAAPAEVAPVEAGSTKAGPKGTSKDRTKPAGHIEIDGKRVEFKDLTEENVKDSVEISAKLDEALKKFGGEDAFRQLAKDWKATQDLARKVKFVRALRGSPLLNAFLEYRATNMLTSVNTSLTNTTSNLTRQMWDNYFQNPIQALWGLTDRNPGESSMSMQEARLRAYSFSRYMLDGFRAIPENVLAAGRAIRRDKLNVFETFNAVAESGGPDTARKSRASVEGYVSQAISRKAMQDSSVGQAINKLPGPIADAAWWSIDKYGSIARALSFGQMNLSDNFFSDLAYKTELDGLMFREAAKRGVGIGEADQGAAMDHWINQQKSLVIGYSEGKQIEAPKDQKKFILDMHDAALKASEDATWRRQLQGASRRIEQSINEAPELRTMIPFFKVPVNLGAWAVEHTPLLSYLSKRANAEIAKGGADRDKAYAKLTSGALLYGAAAVLYGMGVLTPPTDPKERNTQNNAGISGHAINILGKQYQVDRMDPQGMMITTLIDIMSLVGRIPYEKSETLVSAAVQATGGNLLSKTYFSTLSDVFSVVKEPERYGPTFLKNYAGTLLPLGGLARSVNERVDPHARELRNLTDVVLNTYWSSRNQIKLDDFGKEAPDTERFLGNKVTTPRVDSPVRMEMAFLHIPTSMPKEDLVYTADLTEEQFYQFRLNIASLGAEEQMNAFVTSKDYANIDNFEARRDALLDIRTGYQEAARAMLFEDKNVVDAYVKEIERNVARYESVDKHDPKAKIENWRKFLTEGIRAQ